jgi:hypothetical protein
MSLQKAEKLRERVRGSRSVIKYYGAATLSKTIAINVYESPLIEFGSAMQVYKTLQSIFVCIPTHKKDSRKLSDISGKVLYVNGKAKEKKKKNI